MNACLLVIANLKVSILPISVSDALEVQAHDTAPAGILHVTYTMKPEPNFAMWLNLLLHHQVDDGPDLSTLILRLPAIAKRDNSAEVVKRATTNDVCHFCIAANVSKWAVWSFCGHSRLTVILGQSHPRKDKVQNLIHHGAKHADLSLTCQAGRRSGGKRALFQRVPGLNFVLCRIRKKSYKDKVMGPSERRADGGFRSVPGVIFTNWWEALNAMALPGAVRAGYTLAIAGYLDYCRRNRISVTLESARGYMADVTRRGVARNPPLWKQGLN